MTSLTGRKSVVVRTQFEALHRWGSAPGEVNFLSYPHRHIFTVIVTVAVAHGDRAVEFFCLKKEIDDLVRLFFFSATPLPNVVFPPENTDLGLPIISMSCEDMAMCFAMSLADRHAVQQVVVSEDNENAGVFTVMP